MPEYKLISADSHIVEPPDMYTSRISPKLRNRAPHMERRKTPGGREYDAWMLDGATPGQAAAATGQLPPPARVLYRTVWRPRFVRHPRW